MTSELETYFRTLRVERERRDRLELRISIFIAGCLLGVAMVLGLWLVVGVP